MDLAYKAIRSILDDSLTQSIHPLLPQDLEHKPCIPKAPWKAKPPSMGEAETKEVGGKMWHWCTHCGFWQLSHGSTTHKDPATLNSTIQSTTPALSTSIATTTLQFCSDLMFGDE